MYCISPRTCLKYQILATLPIDINYANPSSIYECNSSSNPAQKGYKNSFFMTVLHVTLYYREQIFSVTYKHYIQSNKL